MMDAAASKKQLKRLDRNDGILEEMLRTWHSASHCSRTPDFWSPRGPMMAQVSRRHLEGGER